MAYRMPLADRSDSANERWEDFTAPIVRRFEPLARVFISVDAKKPISIHNLKDILPFQGKITLTGKQAVTVNVNLTPEMAAFLRAQSFDQYSADGWTVNVDGNVPLASRQTTGVDEPQIPDARKELTINVKIEGGNNGVLFSLGQPVAADRPSEARVGADPSDVLSLKPADHLSNGDTYKATGSVAVASIEQLRAAGTDYPQWVTDRYLQLPDNLPFRVRRKAREVVRGAGSSPYDQAVAIETYIRSFPIDYDVPGAPPGRDAVDYFLFDAQRGYFDYHASAMAVMLRGLGIPARVATGYAVDPKAAVGDNTYNLTERNAFAWPEVYFPSIGWVEFSPTPSQPTIYRPGSNQPVPVPTSQASSGRGTEDPIDLGLGSAPATPPELVAKSGGSSKTWPLLIALASVAGVVLAAGAAGKLAWEFGLGGLTPPARLWEKAQRLARLAKAWPRPEETPREFAARLDATVPGTSAVRDLASAYERARYGRTSALSEDEASELDAAWASVRRGLLRRLFRLPPSRRP
ncbi:MAG: DUF4129 domain-containing protein [Dehalococcoidia bacterium]|nr:MAG: DUF4129 domain-containing protein [Dehalococcoidia bacterium]